MANVNLIRTPYTPIIRTYNGGVIQTGTTTYTLEPHGTPILFEFNSNVSGTAFKAIAYYIPTLATTAGSTVTIFGEIFTASANPQTSQEFFSNNLTQPSLGLSMSSLADCINQNTNLNWRFTAESSTTNVKLTAKYTGSSYELIIPTTLDSSSPTWLNIQSGTDGNRGQQLQNYNYTVFAEIWGYSQQPASWGGVDTIVTGANLLTTITQKWNPSNSFIFDVSQYLRSLTSFTLPRIDDTPQFRYFPNHLMPYYIKYGESFNGGYNISTGNPIDTSTDITNLFERKYYINQTPLRWACEGALDLAINDVDKWRLYWENVRNAGTANGYNSVLPLTLAPRYKLVRRTDQAEYLYFFSTNDLQFSTHRSYRIRTIFTFTDGTTDVSTTHLTNNQDGSGLMCVDIRGFYIDLQLVEGNNNKRVLEYTCTIERTNDGGANWDNFTEQSYTLDLNYEPARYNKIYWKNCFGVMDQFEFDGLKQDKLNVDNIEYRQTLTRLPGYQRSKHQSNILKRDSKTRYTFNTGWVDKDHMNFLKDMCLSNKHWIRSTYFNATFDDIPVFLAVNLIDSNWQFDNEDKLFNLEVTFEIAVDDNNLHD